MAGAFIPESLQWLQLSLWCKKIIYLTHSGSVGTYTAETRLLRDKIPSCLRQEWVLKENFDISFTKPKKSLVCVHLIFDAIPLLPLNSATGKIEPCPIDIPAWNFKNGGGSRFTG